MDIFSDELERRAAVSALERIMAERDRYMAAIRKHRDQRGDDRCWMDDHELYSVLPEGYKPPPKDTKVCLENCQRFIDLRENPITEYISPQREIEILQTEVMRLRRILERLHE